MKKKQLLMSLAAFTVVLGAGGLLASCDRDNEVPGEIEQENVPVTSFSLELTSSKSISIGESIHVVPMDITPTNYTTGSFTYSSSATDVATVDDNGKVTGISSGTATISVTSGNFEGDEGDETKTINVTVSGEATTASGANIYAGDSYEDKLDILGKLEEYAINNNLTGIPMIENGGYVMYDERIEKGTENYISGYGFGILAEGRLTSSNSYYDAEGTSNYYHVYDGETNGWTLNYLDDSGSLAADLHEYVASSYYEMRMNSTKDGYEWYPKLANEFPSTDPDVSASNLTETQLNRPVALNANSAGLATRFRIYLKTGYEYDGVNDYVEDSEHLDSNGLTYSASSNGRWGEYFDGRPVSIMDYVYPYILLINGSFDLYRHADFISASNDGTLKGATSYSAATTSSANMDNLDLFFNLVGLDVGLDEDPSSPDAPCLTLEFNSPLSEFDAMYGLYNTLASPIPLDFITTIGTGANTVTTVDDVDASDLDEVVETGIKEAYGITNSTFGTGPVDNMLSVGTHVLEYIDDNEIQFSRNADFIDVVEPGRYDSSFEGVSLHYISGGVESAFQEFIAGHLDVASIPETYLSQYKDDTRTTTTQGSATFKINTNTTDQATWNELFASLEVDEGEEANSYRVNPLMGNDKFVQALSYAIDRETFAENRGYIPSQNYFADAYVWQPEEGRSYNETAQHLGNIADSSPETYGYNFDVAVQLMDEAIEEVIADESTEYTGYNDYTTAAYGGTDRDQNHLGVIQMSWMTTTNPTIFGTGLLAYWDEVFQATDAYRRGFRISFEQDGGSANYQDVYDKMEYGTFDLAFGSISGSTLDPLGFMEVLKSDNSSTFTLNWNHDTDEIDEENGRVIYYDGKKWTYDGLWNAATNGVIIGSDGKVLADPLDLEQAEGYTTGTVTDESWGTISVLLLTINYQKATEAAATEMRFATSSVDTFTFVGYANPVYTEGALSSYDTIVLSLDFVTYAELNDTVNTTAGITDPFDTGTLTIKIPETLTPTMTGLDSNVSATDLFSSYVSFSIYTTYGADGDSEGYTITTGYSVDLSFSS